MNTHVACYAYYVLYSHNRASESKDSVIKNTIRKRKHIHGAALYKIRVPVDRALQTRLVQGSAVQECISNAGSRVQE